MILNKDIRLKPFPVLLLGVNAIYLPFTVYDRDHQVTDPIFYHVNLAIMKQRREKTTILFVNKDSKSLKPIQISNALILNWKKYLAGLILIIFSLIGAIVYLTSNNIQQDRLANGSFKKDPLNAQLIRTGRHQCSEEKIYKN